MKKDNSTIGNGSAVRYGMFIPLAFMIASVITCCLSYSNARQNIANDLNEAMFALADENSELWTRPDTVAAIRQMYETTHKPLIYQASDVNFRIASLKDDAYFTLALVEKRIRFIKSVETKLHLTPSCSCRDTLPTGLQYRFRVLPTVPWHRCSAPRIRHCRVSSLLCLFSQWPECLFGKEGNPRLSKPN